MKNNKKIILIILSVALIIAVISLGVVIKNSINLHRDNNNGTVMNLYGENYTLYAQIKEITKNNILVEGTDVNEEKFQTEFTIPFDENTKVTLNDENIDINNLKEGDKIFVVFKGEMLEIYPAIIKNILEIKLLPEEQYNQIVAENIEQSNLINEFYTEDITQKYKKITELGIDYSAEDAKQDNCYTKIHLEAFNEEVYTDFMQKYNNKESCFMRIISVTIEGDIIIHDVKYDSTSNKVIVIRDLTREEYMNYNDTIISIHEYEKLGVYNDCLVAYNGELSEENVNTENIMNIVLLNQ